MFSLSTRVKKGFGQPSLGLSVILFGQTVKTPHLIVVCIRHWLVHIEALTIKCDSTNIYISTQKARRRDTVAQRTNCVTIIKLST